MLTIRDVAEYCNVSTATVSKAFRQDSDISYETVERVRAAARSLGYYPNAAARSLKTRRAYNLGLLAQMRHKTDISTELVTRVITAFQTEAEASGYDVTFVSKNISGKPISYEEHCSYRNFEGVAVICADFFSPQVRALLDRDVPCVTVDYSTEKQSSVMTGNEEAYSTLARYVHSHGHRKVAVIRDSRTAIADIRYECLCKACLSCGLELPDGYTFPAVFNDVDSAVTATREVLRLPDRPTCIFYPDDIACVGGISEMRRQGLSVPGDISVVGFDGIQLSQIIEPKLTTYRQDTEVIGREALRLLLKSIENPKAAKPEHLLIPGVFYPGETVAAPSQRAHG